MSAVSHPIKLMRTGIPQRFVLVQFRQQRVEFHYINQPITYHLQWETQIYLVSSIFPASDGWINGRSTPLVEHVSLSHSLEDLVYSHFMSAMISGHPSPRSSRTKHGLEALALKARGERSLKCFATEMRISTP